MRIRTIKPEFWMSESVGRLSREARLLFIGLWNCCDDSGRTRAASRLLASLLFPYDEDANGLIEGWLVELEGLGMIRRYVVEGDSYLDIPKWLEHQKIDRPSKSKLPEFASPREDSRALAKNSLGSGNREQGTGKCVQGNGHTHNGDLIQAFKNRLSGEYKRRSPLVWPRLEEEFLVEIVRRPEAQSELNELLDYRSRKPEFFPKSIERLLGNWDKTLDEARLDQDRPPQRNAI